ncbi:hypothetical protein QYE76_009530 [Lolium multiflorum]|uniref:Transposase (putative) gypsy type domain-containing protein n=1 Tax=Lolium multiflorum TaxID=4521 RepID=A0AAD8TVF2_LOLMU|nr:hypothetical protein QYE76_009530 [Lolium multiflorum]
MGKYNNDNDLADVVLLMAADAECVVSFLYTQDDVDAVCKKCGVSKDRHGFFSEALAHFGIAPTQVIPNGWRIMAGFVVLCHFAGLPPSLAVFRHFFGLLPLRPITNKQKACFFFRSKGPSGLCLAGLPHKNNDCEHEFFFLSMPELWTCPVEWGSRPRACWRSRRSTGRMKKLRQSCCRLTTPLPLISGLTFATTTLPRPLVLHGISEDDDSRYRMCP